MVGRTCRGWRRVTAAAPVGRPTKVLATIKWVLTGYALERMSKCLARTRLGRQRTPGAETSCVEVR